ncbi:bifunctional homocysteine S-methyltransferase/methylenetetrahydrofolate reductase [Paenibacillus pinistramenti]|uniref:bifunctional homocysteine S-methyltransferase/methylenetetrahydrofolate reductase n=1 Tax=Paenibacillus pinistramenti TaxID=1768003 RepID=UPI001108E0AA|nr:bifunctional homocysteine S-methyltransferase/methylenetetrahydrofolate reductase [Paenibacillus pinistramenti]
MTDLRKAMLTNVLIGDGAMGTYLSQLGHPVGISYDELNLISPDAIRDIHSEYIRAGADVIETNTFSANAYKLSRFGLEAKTAEINRAGVRIAREAAGSSAYVLGAVGSIRSGRRISVSTKELTRYFGEQIDALLEEGVDGILLETFFDLEEMEIAVKSVRERSGVPVISQFAVDQVGRTLDGYAITDAFSMLKQEGVDVAGFNCHSGPQGIMSVIQNQLPLPLEIPMSVYPNAGLASFVDGKYVYRATPAYFGDRARDFADAGVRLIGGCCGTTPEHITAMAKSLAGYKPRPLSPEPKLARESLSLIGRPAGKEEEHTEVRPDGAAAPTLVDLVKQRHTLIVELDPPRDLDITKFMEGAAALKEAGVDAVTMADNSLAVARMSNMALGHLVQERFGLRTLAHIACRDRNLIGTQSHMMGFDALGINHVLAVTGDPSRFGDLPDASSVYDLTSFQIIKMIKQLNEGIAFSGKPLKHKAKFVVGAAFNPNVKHLDKAVQRLEKKIASGADYIMTQPVYDPDLIVRIKEATAHLDIPIFIGIMPLASGKNADYLHNEVPGIELPEQIRSRMSGLSGEQGRLEGTEIAKELLDGAMQHFNGIYLMTPFLFYEMSVALAKYVQKKSKEGAAHLFHS